MRVRERAGSCAVRGTARPSSVRRDVGGEDGAPRQIVVDVVAESEKQQPGAEGGVGGRCDGEEPAEELPDAVDEAGTPDTLCAARGAGASAGAAAMPGQRRPASRAWVRGGGEERGGRAGLRGERIAGGSREAVDGALTAGGGVVSVARVAAGAVTIPPRSTGSMGMGVVGTTGVIGATGSTEGSSPTITGTVPSTVSPTSVTTSPRPVSSTMVRPRAASRRCRRWVRRSCRPRRSRRRRTLPASRRRRRCQPCRALRRSRRPRCRRRCPPCRRRCRHRVGDLGHRGRDGLGERF